MSFVLTDPALVSLSTASQLSRTVSESILSAFPGSALNQVRGRVSLIKSILEAIRKERRLVDVNVGDMVVEIYTLVFHAESVNAKPVDGAEAAFVRSMAEYLAVERRGICRRFCDAVAAFFR